MDEHFEGFADYLAHTLPALHARLDIPPSRFCGGVSKAFRGIDAVVAAYDWRSRWLDENKGRHPSEDWVSTKTSLNMLRKRLIEAISRTDENDAEILQEIRRVLEWGGNRDWKRGAYPFLETLLKRHELKAYLWKCREAFSLDNSTPHDLDSVVQMMNSMLTKVHALLATDGLPIYDSRVAAAIATLAEQYRQTKRLANLPCSIKFPTVDGKFNSVRHVTEVYPEAVGAFQLRYSHPDRNQLWARAKWRLGKLMLMTLEKNPSILIMEGALPSRCHAFEAALFMLGYNPRCLKT